MPTPVLKTSDIGTGCFLTLPPHGCFSTSADKCSPIIRKTFPYLYLRLSDLYAKLARTLFLSIEMQGQRFMTPDGVLLTLILHLLWG